MPSSRVYITNPYIKWPLCIITLLWIVSCWFDFGGSKSPVPLRVDYRVPVECITALPLKTLPDAQCFIAKDLEISSQLSALQMQAGYDGWDVNGMFFKGSEEPGQFDQWVMVISSVGTAAPVYDCDLSVTPDGKTLNKHCSYRP